MGTYQIPESLTATNSEVQMLNVVDERTTETDRAELTEGDDNNDDDATLCEVFDDCEEQKIIGGIHEINGHSKLVQYRVKVN